MRGCAHEEIQPIVVIRSSGHQQCDCSALPVVLSIKVVSSELKLLAQC
jgi:hypothetical protein